MGSAVANHAKEAIVQRALFCREEKAFFVVVEFAYEAVRLGAVELRSRSVPRRVGVFGV